MFTRLFLLLLIRLTYEYNSSNTSSKLPLHILGLFPFRGSWKGGEGHWPAIEIALKDVNEKEGMLNGYELKISKDDTEVGMNE